MLPLRSPNLLARTVVRLVAPLLVGVILTLLPNAAFAAVIPVDGALCTLPQAITTANDGTLQGTCTLGNASGPDTLLLIPALFSFNSGPNNVPSLGPTALPSIESEITINSVTGATIERIPGSPGFRLFYVAPTGNLRLENVDIRYGDTDQSGGAIYNAGTLNISDSAIYSNTAANDGGGIYNAGSTTTIEASQLSENDADNGGAIANNNGTLVITDTDILTNTVNNFGGGLYNTANATATLTDSAVNANQTEIGGSGGGIFNEANSAVRMISSELVGNAGFNTGGLFNLASTAAFTDSAILSNIGFNVGGVFNAGTLTLFNTEVRDNRSSTFAGGISNISGSTATITDSDIVSNTATFAGGGMYNTDGATVDLTISTVVSNTSVDGAGIFNANGSALTLDNSDVISNTATGAGGGIHNTDSASVTMIDGEVYSNTAELGGGFYNVFTGTLQIDPTTIRDNSANMGGGIYNATGGTAILTDTTVISNYASDSGGGIYNTNNAAATLLDSDIIGNFALNDGGGFVNAITSTATLVNSDLLSNTANTDDAGGLLNVSGSTATLTNSDIMFNKADDGGGFYNESNATIHLIDSDVRANRATFYGGGFVNNVGAIATLTNSNIFANQGSYGGGFFSNLGASTTISNSTIDLNIASSTGGGFNIIGNSAVTLTLTTLLSNTAPSGGGISIDGGAQLSVTLSQLVGNSAETGGALHQIDGTTVIEQSCIVNNTDTAVSYGGGNVIDATDNWWGAADGPSGVGPGNGDSVSSNVLFEPFLTSVLSDCLQQVAEIELAKSASITGNALPGQPLTFTLTITNAGDEPVKNIYVADTLPAGYVLDGTTTNPPGISFNGSSYVITELAASQVATILFAGEVESTLNANIALNNTATLTNGLLAVPLNAAASVNVVVPVLNWSEENYTTAEDSNSFAATVILTPPNPYAEVTVQATYTDSAEAAAVLAVQTITFTPNSGSQQVVIPIADDEEVTPRTIVLGLQTPVGAALGPDNTATIAITEDDAQAGLTVSKHVNPLTAEIGDTITYTFRITNSGNVTFTSIVADDDHLGEITDLAGELLPEETRIAIVPHLLTTDDGPGTLVNTVIVTGTDVFDTVVVESATASVAVTDEEAQPALAVSKHVNTTSAEVGDTITYTFRITNTGDVTFTTIVAEDDHLGAIGGLEGEWLPDETRAITVPHLLTNDDGPGTLVNTVIVTGTDVFDTVVVESATASVAVSDPTNLPEGPQPNQPRMEIYLPRIEGE